MSPQNIRRIDTLTCQLAENLITAVLCAEEIRTVVHAELEDGGASCSGPPSRPPAKTRFNHRQRPFVDESTMRVFWNGSSLHLGNTLPFRLLRRLARRPNQYVTHVDLLQDVWDGRDIEITTIRSTVRHLQRKLRAGGMDDLAAAIRGHNGHYILQL